MSENRNKYPPELLQDTLPRTSPTRSGRRRSPDDECAICATIVYHSTLNRIGERAPLWDFGQKKAVELSRLEPSFSTLDGGDAGPLADAYLSRSCARLEGLGNGDVVISATKPQDVRIDGRELGAGNETISVERLDTGVLVELQGRVALMLGLANPALVHARDTKIVGRSRAVSELLREIERVAASDVPVLIRGESGTGKELVAHRIHASSGRAHNRIVSVNMAAVHGSTAASELFGHVKGAFTGADAARKGHFVRADGGTLFLDEAGETPQALQVMLLRVLETGELLPVGADAERKVDVRIIAATDADLERAAEEKTFRLPLLHRLAAYPIDVPPLRDRAEDVAVLLRHFLEQELGEIGEAWRLDAVDPSDEPWLSLEQFRALMQYPWPGNVRELLNAVKQIVLASRGAEFAQFTPALRRKLSAAPVDERAVPAAHSNPEELPEDELRAALRSNQWEIRATARQLGISKTSLYRLIKASPNLRTARDIDEDELVACIDRHGDDVKEMARSLEVSAVALRLRLKELGLRA